MRKVSLISAISLLLLCSASYAHQDESATQSDISNVKISMTRTACFGACPAYSLTVWGSGVVHYQGHSSVRVRGHRATDITESAVRQLVNKFEEIDFFSLEDVYGPKDLMDAPRIFVTYTANGETKTVCTIWNAPKELTELQEMIDTMTGSERWTAYSSQ